MTYTAQVGKGHYEGHAYRSDERWMSYFHQLTLVGRTGAREVLEVGVGSGVLARELRQRGVDVKTLDVAADLKPDILGSVTDIPLPSGSVDAAVACEVLEHIEFSDVPKALAELARVARTHVVVSLPHPGWVASLIFKVPLLRRHEVFFQIPFFWRRHIFNGEHYWELGTKGYPVGRFVALARDAGLRLVAYEKFADDPAHRFFLFET
jgi:ubiquinone/menaquinone biosynthesis C-methylase UbiE